MSILHLTVDLGETKIFNIIKSKRLILLEPFFQSNLNGKNK